MKYTKRYRKEFIEYRWHFGVSDFYVYRPIYTDSDDDKSHNCDVFVECSMLDWDVIGGYNRKLILKNSWKKRLRGIKSLEV